MRPGCTIAFSPHFLLDQVMGHDNLTLTIYDRGNLRTPLLKSGTGHHEAQGDFSYTYLVLDKGVCVDAPKDGGDDDFGNTGTENPVERIQIAGEASQQALPIGERVKVKGTLFGAHTMWHVEEVLIDAPSVERK